MDGNRLQPPTLDASTHLPSALAPINPITMATLPAAFPTSTTVPKADSSTWGALTKLPALVNDQPEATATHGAELMPADCKVESIEGSADQSPAALQELSVRASVKKYFERTNFPVSTGSKQNPIDISENETHSVQTFRPSTRAKGRSLGEGSSKPIKALRDAASKGDIEAALKLGWAVERLTEIFNRNKAKRGILVPLDSPIDDPDLVARIEERKHSAREATRRRSDKLKARAHAGDIEAAKKLGLGKKKMSAMFPRPDRDNTPSPIEGLRGNPSNREPSSSEARDWEHEVRRAANWPPNTHTRGLDLGRIHGRKDKGHGVLNLDAGTGAGAQSQMCDRTLTKLPGIPAPATSAIYVDSPTSWPGHYSSAPPSGFEIEVQLQAALLEARRHVAVATGRVAELETFLKTNMDARQRPNVALYEAMTKTSRQSSDSDTSETLQRSSSGRSWTFIQEDGQSGDMDSE